MIRTGVKLRLVAFALLSAVGLAYAGANYVGITDELLGRGYTVVAELDRSGGLYVGSAVTYRGVPVGEVGDMKATRQGARAYLDIEEGWRVPAGARAEVHNKSAVGEQYLDLQPKRAGGPYLRDGDVIPNARTTVPVPEEELLVNLDRLVRSVDSDDLATVIDELGKAFRGTAPDLRRLLDSGDALTAEAMANLPATTRLLEDANTFLRTQNQQASHIQSAAADLADLTEALRSADRDIAGVLDHGRAAARQLDELLQSIEPTLPVLAANLISVNQVLAARLPAVEELLVLYPELVASGFTGTPGDGTGHVTVQLDPLTRVCQEGYLPPSQWRAPSEMSDAKPYTRAYCAEGMPTTARGSKHAPGRGDDGPPFPGPSPAGGKADPPGPSPTEDRRAAGAQGGGVVTFYDPLSGSFVGPDGQRYQVGGYGGQHGLLGEDSWKWLLIGPLSAG